MKVSIKVVLGFVGIVIAALSALMIIVDGVAIIFTYVSLVFALCLIGLEDKGILKVYGVVFVIAHLVLGWRMYSDSSINGFHYLSLPPNLNNFEICGDRQFRNIGESQGKLTPENKNPSLAMK